jgi:hypothetical protein
MQRARSPGTRQASHAACIVVADVPGQAAGGCTEQDTGLNLAVELQPVPVSRITLWPIGFLPSTLSAESTR